MTGEGFFTLRTILWEDGTIVAVDQRLLPKRFKYIKIRSIDQLSEAIKNLTIRGAPAIGVAAALGLALVAYRSKAENLSDFKREIMDAYEKLKSTRPTAVNLFWALDRVVAKISEAKDLEEAKKMIIEEAKTIWMEDYEVNKRIGEHGAMLLENGDMVLTHCKWLKPAECGSTSYYWLWDSASGNKVGCS
jgi:methylthioribose-1-phosphate isomerase